MQCVNVTITVNCHYQINYCADCGSCYRLDQLTDYGSARRMPIITMLARPFLNITNTEHILITKLLLYEV